MMYAVNELPKMDMSTSETGCCPRFQSEPWDDKELIFSDMLFVKASTKSIFYLPMNMGKVMSKTMLAIDAAKAQSPDQYLIMSQDVTPWKCDHYFKIEKEVPGLEMVRFTGTYLTKVFEGPYKDVPVWMKEMENYVKSKGKSVKQMYSFYTTCPKCAKQFGKNYVVLLAQV